PAASFNSANRTGAFPKTPQQLKPTPTDSIALQRVSLNDSLFPTNHFFLGSPYRRELSASAAAQSLASRPRLVVVSLLGVRAIPMLELLSRPFQGPACVLADKSDREKGNKGR